MQGGLTLLGVALIATVLGFGCKRIERGEDRDGYSIVRNKDGGETRVRLGAGPVPPEFPPNMPLYPGAEFSSTARTAKNTVLLLSTHDSLDAVFAFYRKQPDYEEVSDVEVDGMRVLHLKHKASGKDVQVVVKIGGQSTEISLVTTPR